jgi:hypothetical protein
MLGFRQCEGCKRELPKELFREGNPQCRICAREAEQRNPVVRIAAGIIAQPRERWAKALRPLALNIAGAGAAKKPWLPTGDNQGTRERYVVSLFEFNLAHRGVKILLGDVLFTLNNGNCA